MLLSSEFQPFVQGAPCAVITRLVGEWLLDDKTLGQLFGEHAVRQYEREITLSNLVNVMLDVACGSRRSPRAAFLAREDEIAASLSAFYGKVNRTETAISQALVEHTAQAAGKLIRAVGGLLPEPIPGVRSFILDGNMLTGTDHRLKPLRPLRAAALPGKSLAFYECGTGLVTKTVLEEDAHAQERALLPQLSFEAGTHIIADRNFCVRSFLCRLAKSGVYFTIRHHRGSMPLANVETVGKRRRCGRCETGVVYEKKILLRDDDQNPFVCRLITLKLDTPTRDGDEEIILVSAVPTRVRATRVAMAYRERWTIEGHFQRLTDWLHCEVPTLSHPKAALFAFAMSLLAGNLLATLIAAIRGAHGAEAAQQLSYYALADEVGGTYRGMMLALPPERWSFVRTRAPAQMAKLLTQVARHANPDRLRKTIRGPKKPRRTPNCTNIRHVSTYRILTKHQQTAP